MERTNEFEDFDPGLAKWGDDENGTALLELFDAISDAADDGLGSEELQKIVSSAVDGNILKVPKGLSSRQKDSIRAKLMVRRLSNIYQSLVFELTPDNNQDLIDIRILWSEIFISGALLTRVLPDYFPSIEYLQKRKPGREKQADAARETNEKKTAWHGPAEALIESLLDAHPNVTSKGRAYQLFEPFLHIPGATPGVLREMIGKALAARRAK